MGAWVTATAAPPRRPAAPATRALICRAGSCLCAVPVELVAETMRPLPVEPLRDAPPFVLGMSIVRGMVVPVVDLAACVGVAASAPTRFVTVHVGGSRLVALAVSAVTGVRQLSAQVLADLPPLLREASRDVVTAIGVLDAQALLVLDSSFAVPDALWAEVERADAEQADAEREASAR